MTFIDVPGDTFVTPDKRADLTWRLVRSTRVRLAGWLLRPRESGT